MNKSRFYLAPFFVFFDFKIYREARNLTQGAVLGFLVYLSLLFSLAMVIFGAVHLPQVDEFLASIKRDFPAMTLSQSGMKLDKSGHYELKYANLGVIAVFDDQTVEVPREEAERAMIYVTSKMVYIKKNGTMEAAPIGSRAKKDFSAHIDEKVIDRFCKAAKVPVFIFLFLAIFIFGILSRILTALIFAILGLFIQLFIPRQIGFGQLFNISCFVLAIAVPFNFFQYVPVLAKFFSSFVGFILAVVYLVLAIATQPKSE